MQLELEKEREMAEAGTAGRMQAQSKGMMDIEQHQQMFHMKQQHAQEAHTREEGRRDAAAMHESHRRADAESEMTRARGGKPRRRTSAAKEARGEAEINED